MTGIPGFHNISMPLDVDNDLQISPLDALVVINQINANFAMPTPAGERPEAIPDPFISGPIISGKST